MLQDFAKSERPTVEKLLDVAAAEAPRLVAGDEAGFMNRVSLAMNPPKPKPPRVVPVAEPLSAPEPDGAAAPDDAAKPKRETGDT